MDRTIHYFQDRNDIWIVRSTISGIGLSMDRTIHYFQDGTEYGSYDPLFPGFEEVEKIRLPIFPGYEEVEKNQISNISSLIENVADLNFYYFQDRNN